MSRGALMRVVVVLVLLVLAVSERDPVPDWLIIAALGLTFGSVLRASTDVRPGTRPGESSVLLRTPTPRPIATMHILRRYGTEHVELARLTSVEDAALEVLSGVSESTAQEMCAELQKQKADAWVSTSTARDCGDAPQA